MRWRCGVPEWAQRRLYALVYGLTYLAAGSYALLLYVGGFEVRTAVEA